MAYFPFILSFSFYFLNISDIFFTNMLFCLLEIAHLKFFVHQCRFNIFLTSVGFSPLEVRPSKVYCR